MLRSGAHSAAMANGVDAILVGVNCLDGSHGLSVSLLNRAVSAWPKTIKNIVLVHGARADNVYASSSRTDTLTRRSNLRVFGIIPLASWWMNMKSIKMRGANSLSSRQSVGADVG